jgi:pimeloyl-ACP methyl ester carboxylesterase
MDVLHLERAAIAGHSIGGYVALAFFRMYAERVAGLALIASHVAEDAGRNPNADPAQRALAAVRDELSERLEREGTMDAAVAGYLPRYFAAQVYRERPELLERARALMQRQNPRGCAQLVRGMKERLDSHDLLEDVAVPALVVAGGADHFLKAETLRETAAAMRAEFVLLENAGHLPMWEAPAETADALATLARRSRG